ncbi:hypothetical protein Pyrfu_0659 [Pyrolobus fumarii 1A]|uniref:Uncharacterized protein n=1 Tax=Pyrolobus fumarii (strain DSM 11204 / 1A) TaxID=694429 RepID=G0EHF3_PYRF1|nr:hypothetical protein Pyrfu_0659 [Pyrolobus fumarii 1A]
MEYNTRFLLLSTTLLLLLLAPHTHALAAEVGGKGFVIAPTRIDAVVPQGKWTSVVIRFLGVPATEWRAVHLMGLRDGVEVRLSPVYSGGGLVGINVTIIALRPGFYKYGVYVVGPSEETASGVRARPVILVPVNILVPGVRTEILDLRVDPVSRTARLCYGLGVYGLEKLGVDKIEANVVVLVDGERVLEEKRELVASTSSCITLGPYERGTSHHVLVAVEVPDVSSDAEETFFVIGKLTAYMRVSLSAEKLQVVLFGGLVRADYRITVTMNTTRCSVDGFAGMHGVDKRVKYDINGVVGNVTRREIGESVAVYKPLSPLPVEIVKAWINVTLACSGIGKVRAAYTSTDIIVVDAGVLSTYAGLAAVAAMMVMRMRRRRRKRRHEANAEG